MINEIIKYMRKTKNLKQKDLAKLCDIAITTLSGYETNYSQPTFDMIEKIANTCNFEIQFINKSNNEIITTKNIYRKEI